MPATACIWQIKTNFSFRYIKYQDLKVRLYKLNNVNVYIGSYFMEAKESNTIYPWQIEALGGQDFTVEMFNTTFIYVVPIDSSKPTEFEMSFEVF